MEYETLDLEEVKKVIKGESIRSIREVLDSDKAALEERTSEEEKRTSPTATTLPKAGQQQTATRARGV